MKRETKDFLKKKYYWIIFAICVASLIGLTIATKTNSTTAFDNAVYSAVSKHISDGLTFFAKTVSNLADTYWLVGLSLMILLLGKNKRTGMAVFTNLSVAFLTNHTLKYIIQRPRPSVLRLAEEKGYSFPSGHSMVGMAFYGFLIYLVYKKVKNKGLKWSLITIMSLLVLTVGISRVYLGVHYITDVMAGFILGIAYLILFINSWLHRFRLDFGPTIKTPAKTEEQATPN